MVNYAFATKEESPSPLGKDLGRGLDSKKTPDHRRDDHQEHAGPEPGCRNFPGIGITAVPFRIDFDGTDQAEHRADCIHQIGSRVEIASHFCIRFLDTGITVL